MKREQWEQWILLDQAGDLSPARGKKLQRQLQQDPELAAWKREITQLTESARLNLPADAGPMMPGLPRLARRQQQRDSRQGTFWTLWQPAMGYAAVAIALLMVVYYYSRTSSPANAPVWASATPPGEEALLAWEAPYADDLGDLENQIAGLESSWADAGSEDNTDLPSDLNTLAEELLRYGESS